MKTRAAVAVEAGKPLEIMDVVRRASFRRSSSRNKSNRYMPH